MTDTFWTAAFWRNVAELAAKGAAAGFLMGVGKSPFNAWTVDWWNTLGFTIGGALVMFAFSVYDANKGPQKGTPLRTLVAPHGWNPVDPLGDD